MRFVAAVRALPGALRVVGAVTRNNLRISLTERTFTLVSILIPLNYLCLFLIAVSNGGQAPTAVVVQESGPLARQFLASMDRAHSFAIHLASQSAADSLMKDGRVVATIVIPAGFDAAVGSGHAVALPVTINNLDVDFTDDIRRALPRTITDFYSHVAPQQALVRVTESDVQTHDTGYIPYVSVSVVVIAIMVGSLLQGSVNAAREFETKTITELLLAPAGRWAIQAGMVASTVIINAAGVAVVFAVVALLVGAHPMHWPVLALSSAVLMILFATLGALLGTALRHRHGLSGLSILIALPMLSLSGAFQPVSWGDQVIAAVAPFTPTYYANALFQYGFHGVRTTPVSLGVDLLALAGYIAVAVLVTVMLLERRDVKA